jgi:hypothetical protein
MDASSPSSKATVNASENNEEQSITYKTPPRKVFDASLKDQFNTPTSTEPATPRTGFSSLASSNRHSSLLSTLTAWTTPPTSPASPLYCRSLQKVEPLEMEMEMEMEMESKIAIDLEKQQQQDEVEFKIKPLPLGIRLGSPADVAEILRRGKRETMPPPCLQCTLKGLPCDERFPHCSRCARAGEGELCLNQRPLWQSEVEQDDCGFWMMRFTLVRFQEDDETWARKKKLETEVLDSKQWKAYLVTDSPSCHSS